MKRLVILLLGVVLLGGGLWFWSRFNQKVPAPPPTPAERFSAGLDAIAMNDLDAAQAILKELEPTPKYRDHARVLRASLYLKQNAPDLAVEELAEDPLVEEVRVRASLLLAEAFHRLGDLANAQRAADFALKFEPDNLEAHRRLAAVYYDLGANGSAVVHLNAVVKLAPDDYRPRHLLGQIHFDAENYQAAATALQSALERHPPPPQGRDVVLLLAQALLKTHRYDEASRLLDEHAADNADLLALNSEAHWAQGNSDQAKRLLSQAETIDPANRFLLLQKARIAIHEGQLQPAVSALEGLLKADPHDTESRYQLAQCFQKLGKPDRYQREIARFEESQSLKRQLADLSDQAILQPTNAEIRDRIAALFEKLGRPEIAAAYRRAAEACRRIGQ